MKLLSKQATFRDLVVLSLLFSFYSCNFAQSVEKDLQTGLTTRGKGLSCDKVYLSDGEIVIKRNAFIYGERYYVNFDGMDGFVREDGNAFPDMQLLIVGEQGDTAMYLTDLYASYKEGIDFSPLELYAEVTVADPMHSGGTYTLTVDIGDKRGEGTLKATLEFTVVRDEKIKLGSKQVSSREIYLFSQQKGLTITNGLAGFNENIYLLFEGLEGFVVTDGKVELGLSLVVKDADGNVILDESDLLGGSSMSYEDVHAQLAPNFILTGSQIANPIGCKVRIWDKRSDAWISASTELVVE